MAKGPVLIELDGEPTGPSPAEVAPVPEVGADREEAALQRVASLAARRPSRLARWFWSALLALLGFLASVAAYDALNALVTTRPLLGMIAMGLLALVLFLLVIVFMREIAAFARLRKVDRLQAEAERVLAEGDIADAQAVVAALKRLYRGREDTAWGMARLDDRAGEIFDADGLVTHAETCLLIPLDRAARREVETAARQVATVTAIVPLALADLFAALAANMRMIRRIAEIYGGRSGFLGSWRLTRAVFAHLVATGAVAVGDDLLGSLAGGGVLSKLSRRFGEGLINGALTARVGVAAMEVCRPLPFTAAKRPSVSAVVASALGGFLGKSELKTTL